MQFAFWVQQILVVNIEKRRKDYAQMFTHHIITCTLMFASYSYHQTKVGNLILCFMDGVDILLAVSLPIKKPTASSIITNGHSKLAKVLKYMQFQLACDIAFGVFMVVWFMARHVLYLLVCYSVYRHIPEETTYGCFWGSASDLHGPIDPPDLFNHLLQPFRDPEGLVCWNDRIKWMFLSTLLILQIILLIWFGMIVKVARKVLRGGEADDVRSDGEDAEEDEDLDDPCEKDPYEEDVAADIPPLEEEVGVDAINLKSRKTSPGRRYMKVGSTASGVTIPSDRKELLGRIGCDKGS